jgi:hypothetical protein
VEGAVEVWLAAEAGGAEEDLLLHPASNELARARTIRELRMWVLYLVISQFVIR